MLKHKCLLIVFLLLVAFKIDAQGFSQEVGVVIGPADFRSDYGQRNNFETNSGNTGINFGIVHYLNFSYRADCNCYTPDTFINDHIKLKTELSWTKVNLNHFGEYQEGTTDEAARLRGHTGKVNNFDIGMEIEYYPLSIRSFQGYGYSFAPFISLGTNMTFYNPVVETNYVNASGTNDVGNITDPNNFFPDWEPGSISNEKGSTFSFTASVGARYKLTLLSDLVVALRWKYYGSDWIDGLNHQLDSNQSNDWMVWVNFGYIYYLD